MISFIKSQFKIVKIEIIIFFILLLIWTVPTLIQEYFSPYEIIDKYNGYYSSTGGPGGSLLFKFFFFIPSMILLPIFGVILVNKLLLKEISKGYFSSWLTTSMSRQKILNSKFFVILSSILFLNISILLMQLILFSSIFKDFNSQMALYLFLYFLSLIFFSILFTSITWFISCYFCDKQSLSIALISGVLTVFFVFYIIGHYASEIKGLENLKYFDYFTIMSFLKPIIFNNPTHNQGVNLGNIQNFDFVNFAWQIPVVLILIGGLFILGNWFFSKKDLFL
ncbi:ABC transporter permease subunit [Spiroplasma endosymbiont of Nebria brevicollis]|uniref:ABC transporter permease subunit n=1 Tax=Spiroplasma endosymbiont of Nebria brevicollis TaxID=3066284 RepID=UPI00313CFDBF